MVRTCAGAGERPGERAEQSAGAGDAHDQPLPARTNAAAGARGEPGGIEPMPARSRREWLLAGAGGVLAGSAPGRSDAAVPAAVEPKRAPEPPAPAAQETGITALRNPAIYRGAATEKQVRKTYRLDGLLPARKVGLKREAERAQAWLARLGDPLDKYQALMTLKETNRDCFFALLATNLREYLPLVYTPTVGQACQEWSHLLHRPSGLYISMSDLGNVKRVVGDWPEMEAKIAVITDGERILGLGDLGVNGLGISVGKAIVHTLAGGIHPRLLVPIVLDVGCDSPSVRDDKLYLGLQQERVRGPKYDQLVNELLKALRERYGQSLLVHWEDFAARNSYRLLASARAQDTSTFNDDIESTAAALLAAVLGATQVKGVPPLRQQRLLFFGAGQSSVGGARLLRTALQAEGLGAAEARDRIWLWDSQGLVHAGRGEGQLSPEKAEFQRSAEEGASLAGASFAEAVARVRPTALVGASAQRGAFSAEVLQAQLRGVEAACGEGARPIVLALSNPGSRAECTAQEARDATDARAVFASGTAFEPIRLGDGGLYTPSQANNCLIFPGLGLGCIASGATRVTDDMMLAAARAVARKVTKQELEQGAILPAVDRLREVALSVAAAVALVATEAMLARTTGADTLSCLLGKRPEEKSALKQAEECIAQLRYDPFASEQVAPNPVNPILLRLAGGRGGGLAAC